MSVPTQYPVADTLFGILTVACWVLVAATVVLGVAARRSGAWARWRDMIHLNGLRLAALIAVVTLVGSLFYSEVANFKPCLLCWYQRIGLYPLAIILPIAAFREDWDIRVYVMPINVLAALVSLWHVLEERWPTTFASAVECDPSVPCSVPWFKSFGFMTLAWMALTASVTIFTLLLVGGSRSDLGEDEDEDENLGDLGAPAAVADGA